MKPGIDLHCFDAHNDRYFAHLPLIYVNGVIFNMVVPRMPYEKFAEYLEEKYGNYFQGLYYQVPNIKLERGLVRDEMEVKQQDGSSQHPQKTDKGKEKVSQDKTKGVEAMTNTTDKGKEKVSQDETEGVNTRTSTVVSDYDNEFDSEYDSDKSIDYLSPGEEEFIEVRNRMKANREAKAKAKGNSISKINEPNVENSMPADNVGEKYVTVEQFKECLTYYALANGFSLWYEKSSGKKVVAKCGQRPPRLFVPDKGKQRKRSVVCFAGLTDGWKARCRKVIALDGCFLQLKLVLELLEEDLGCIRGNGLTLMSDQHKERITRTKRSKNSQKPTRNERDKNKSEESAKDQSRISPTQKERKSKTPIEVKGLKVTSSQSLKGLFEVLEFKGPKLPKVEKRFIKEEKEEENHKD
ncbi:hypothetical protein Tco_1531135 [Tanacetum coccineum]